MPPDDDGRPLAGVDDPTHVNEAVLVGRVKVGNATRELEHVLRAGGAEPDLLPGPGDDLIELVLGRRPVARQGSPCENAAHRSLAQREARSNAMYMRIVRNALQPGQFEEFTRRWEAYFPARYTQMAGFQRAYLGYDAATNGIVAITLWDARPDPAMIATHVAEFRPQVADLSSGPPTFDEFDIVVTA